MIRITGKINPVYSIEALKKSKVMNELGLTKYNPDHFIGNTF